MKQVLEYIENSETTIEGEWGRGREFDKLLSEGDVPDIYSGIQLILKGVSEKDAFDLLRKERLQDDATRNNEYRLKQIEADRLEEENTIRFDTPEETIAFMLKDAKFDK